MSGALIDMTGRVYGRLTVTRLECVQKQAFWLCKCECGSECVVSGYDLRIGHTKSCGCWKNDATSKRRYRHGLTGTKVYQAWCRMRTRCYNRRNRDYPDYGGRGIRVCEAWRSSFMQFLDDMGLPPTTIHSLGRKDNDGDYTPENCRWELPTQQANNKRSVPKYYYKGRTLSVAELSRESGINKATLYKRIVLLGWQIDKAVAL